MKFNILIIPALAFVILSGCSNKNKKADAYGNFESTETLVASEMQGKLVSFPVTEGETLKKGAIVAIVDTVQLSLKLEQLVAQRKMSATKFQNTQSQIAVQEDQKKTLLIEKKRLENLLKDNAAPAKQLDDINGRISLIDNQVASIRTQNATISSELEMLDKQIAQVADQVKRCKVENPVNGTVLEKYLENAEIVTPGKLLYKIADLNTMILRAYVSGDQLSEIKIGQKVTVRIDKTDNEYFELPGNITWVSPQAEFTPKIIQTKKERINLVYAIKIDVKNDGKIKIGMPGEVVF